MSCFCEKKEGIKKISELKRKSSNFEGMKKSRECETFSVNNVLEGLLW